MAAKSLDEDESNSASSTRIFADGHDYPISISSNQVFQLLSRPRSRELIRAIANQMSGKEDVSALKIRDLSEEVASERWGVKPYKLSGEERRSAFKSISQVHAQVLHEYGIATYNTAEKTLEPSPDIVALSEMIEMVDAVCA